MKQLSKILLSLLVFLMLNGCATIYVHRTANQGVQPHVKKEMVKNEKRIREEQRKTSKVHNERRTKVKNAQKQPWI